MLLVLLDVGCSAALLEVFFQVQGMDTLPSALRVVFFIWGCYLFFFSVIPLAICGFSVLCAERGPTACWLVRVFAALCLNAIVRLFQLLVRCVIILSHINSVFILQTLDLITVILVLSFHFVCPFGHTSLAAMFAGFTMLIRTALINCANMYLSHVDHDADVLATEFAVASRRQMQQLGGSGVGGAAGMNKVAPTLVLASMPEQSSL